MIEIFESISQGTLSRVNYLASAGCEVRINSSGGDVFAGLSCYNTLKPLKCEVQIVGLCASAATLIACAGVKVSMAANALYCIHNPKMLLIDYYDKDKLEQLQNSLLKTEESILMVYRSRVKDFEMPEKELWLSAAEAQSLGFVDEIIDEVPVVMDAGQAIINSVSYDLGRVEGLKGRVHATPPPNAAFQRLINLIEDNMKSGSQGVGSQIAPTAEDIKRAQLNKMIAFAKGELI